MDAAHALWSGFDDELDDLFEKAAGKRGLWGKMFGRSPKAISAPSAAGKPIRARSDGDSILQDAGLTTRGLAAHRAGANTKLREVPKKKPVSEGHPYDPGFEHHDVALARWKDNPNIKWGDPRHTARLSVPRPGSPMAIEAAGPKPDVDDLGAMVRWIRARTPVGPARSRMPDPPKPGPYGRVQLGVSSAERQLASTKARLPQRRLTAEELAELESQSSLRASGLESKPPFDINSSGIESLASARYVHWTGFADELDKLSSRRHFLPDGREVDLNILEPLLAGRSIDTATEEEIAQAAPKPGRVQRLGSWFRSRIPFLCDEE